MINAYRLFPVAAVFALASACVSDPPQICYDAIDCAGFIDDNFGSATQPEAESLFLSEACVESAQASDACALACGQFLDDSQALIDQSDVEDTGICRR